MSEVYRHNDAGRVLTLGAHPRRQYDPREERYRLARVVDVSQVDLGQPYSLVWRDSSNGNLWDPRPAITDQDGIGACAAFAAVEIAEICSWQAGAGQPVRLCATELYERDRKKENGSAWQDDSGSTLADNLDFAISGLYAAADVPENYSLSFDFSSEDQSKRTYQYVAAHLPFYPQESSDPDYFVKAIAASIDQGMAVDLGSDWYQPWFTPDGNGVLPLANLGQAVGGHSYYAYAVLPQLGGIVVCANHWTPGWNPQATHLGQFGRPGEFGVPFAFFRGNASAYIEGRAVHWQAVPPPQPSDPCTDVRQQLAGITAERDKLRAAISVFEEAIA